MSKKILIVDDEPSIVKLVKMSLAVEGYDVKTAGSGLEALEIMDEEQQDLVILDIMMPGMDGYEVCSEIRKRPNSKDSKVIFLTARGNSSDAQQGFAVGGNDYIIKPFDFEELLEKIKNIIGQN